MDWHDRVVSPGGFPEYRTERVSEGTLSISDFTLGGPSSSRRGVGCKVKNGTRTVVSFVRGTVVSVGDGMSVNGGQRPVVRECPRSGSSRVGDETLSSLETVRLGGVSLLFDVSVPGRGSPTVPLSRSHRPPPTDLLLVLPSRDLRFPGPTVLTVVLRSRREGLFGPRDWVARSEERTSSTVRDWRPRLTRGSLCLSVPTSDVCGPTSTPVSSGSFVAHSPE